MLLTNRPSRFRPYSVTTVTLLLALLLPLLAAQSYAVVANPYFRITVVDEQTSRGVPLVRLRSTDSSEHWTDSRGVIAYNEPEMIGKDVYFAVETYGYSLSSGAAGVTLHPSPGGSTTVTLSRQYAAQRIYRVTGVNVYADSKLLGDTVPENQAPADILVAGQDSVIECVFKNKIYLLWGDTGIQTYPLGNFHTTGATADLPGQGGLDPEEGIYLNYFRDSQQKLLPMVNINTSHLIWCGNMRATTDGAEEVLVTDYDIVSGLTSLESGLAKFNEATKQFDKVLVYPADAVIRPGGVPFRYDAGGKSWFYYARSWPAVRSPIDYASLRDLSTFEAFSCLKPGSKYNPAAPAAQLERDASGDLVWGWKKNTSPIQEAETKDLVKRGIIQANEEWYQLKDIETGERVQTHNASVFWNEYRQRWVAVLQEMWGATLIGEAWYFEGDTPLGPWVYGAKIHTHANAATNSSYSFYNLLQHPNYSKDGGRVIFYEGTYTDWLAGPDHTTPEYNYNQMMFKLELDDPRVMLPVPVYHADSATTSVYRTKTALGEEETSRTISFLAPDRQRARTIPIYERPDPAHPGGVILSADSASASGVAFYGVDRSAPLPSGTDVFGTVPLYEHTSVSGRRLYSVEASITDPPGYSRSAEPVCRVWPYPIKFNPHRIAN